tara:strand:- start:274 stop:444 length:171 start_codon:yes stop_codon:yes gene_type:complete
LQTPANKNTLRFYKSQLNPTKMLIVCIDEIVKKNREIDFIIKGKEILKVNKAFNLW